MTVQELNNLFGKNVRYYRKKKGWTQTRLAKEVGIAANTLSDYERGVCLPLIKQLVLLGYMLGVDVWRLFYEADK